MRQHLKGTIVCQDMHPSIKPPIFILTLTGYFRGGSTSPPTKMAGLTSAADCSSDREILSWMLIAGVMVFAVVLVVVVLVVEVVVVVVVVLLSCDGPDGNNTITSSRDLLTLTFMLSALLLSLFQPLKSCCSLCFCSVLEEALPVRNK